MCAGHFLEVPFEIRVCGFHFFRLNTLYNAKMNKPAMSNRNNTPNA